jgi:hypothetical protein
VRTFPTVLGKQIYANRFQKKTAGQSNQEGIRPGCETDLRPHQPKSRECVDPNPPTWSRERRMHFLQQAPKLSNVPVQAQVGPLYIGSVREFKNQDRGPVALESQWIAGLRDATENLPQARLKAFFLARTFLACFGS